MLLQMAAEVLKLLVTALTAADALGPAAQQAVMDLLLPLLCEAAAGQSPTSSALSSSLSAVAHGCMAIPGQLSTQANLLHASCLLALSFQLLCSPAAPYRVKSWE